jgi:hypothetical protein
MARVGAEASEMLEQPTNINLAIYRVLQKVQSQLFCRILPLSALFTDCTLSDVFLLF